MTEEKFDFEPATVADALAWVQKMNEEVHTLPITKEEIEATLKSAHNYPHKDLWVIFQPHTYSRTRAFLDDFAGALSHADKVILADIYAAREKDPGDISSRDIVTRLEALGTEVYYFPTFKEIEEFVKEKCTNGDMLITMGAGDVVNIGENLLKK